MMRSDQMKEKMENTLDRRRFLKWLGVCGLGLSPLALARPIQDGIFARGLTSATATRPLMGTLVTVTVLHPSKDGAFEAMEGAFSEMDRLIPVLDRHADDTPVAYLNRTGRLGDVPPALHAVMHRAEKFYRLTHGRFDISVKPILDLFERRGERNESLPSHGEIRSALERVSARYVVHKEKEIRFLKEGMGVTLDAIVDACWRDGAASVRSAVLVEKMRERTCDFRPDFVGVRLPDRYLYGYGLDYRGYFRNADGIYAVADEDV